MNFFKVSLILLIINCINLKINASVNIEVNVDSLEAKVSSETDTLKKIEIFNSYSKKYVNSSTEQSIKSAKSALILAKQLKNKKHIAESYKNIGGGLYFLRETDKAIIYTDSALTVFLAIKDSAGVAKVLNNLGIFHELNSDYKNALLYYLESFQYKNKADNKSGYAKTNLNIGGLYLRFLKIDEALFHLNEALFLYKDINNKHGILKAYNNIGAAYIELGNFIEAEKFINQSLLVSKEVKNDEGIAFALGNLGKIYLEGGNEEVAMSFCLEAQKLKDELKLKDANTLYNIGELYFRKNEYSNSLKYFRKALDIATQTESRSELVDIYFGLQKVYAAQKQFENSNFYLKSYNEEYEKLKEEIHSYALTELQEKFASEKRDREISDLYKKNKWSKMELQSKQQEVKFQKILLYAAILLLIIIIGFSFWVYILYRKNQKGLRLLENQHSKVTQSKIELQNINLNLSESEERLAKIVENIPVMINAMGHDGQFKLWNKYCEKKTGHSKSEILNNPKALTILYPDENYLNFVLSVSESKKYKYKDYKTEVRCKDGSKKVISWSNISTETPIKEWREWACGIDISDSTKANIYVRDENESLLNFLPDIIFVLNKAGTYIDVKSNNEDLLLIPATEIIGQNISDMGFKIKQIQDIQNAINLAIETNEVQTIEYFFNSDIGIRYFEARIIKRNDSEVVSFVRDITSQHATNQDKNQKIDSLNRILETVPEPIVFCDLDGKITYSNAAISRLFGFAELEEFRKENLFNLILSK
ncbi:MAG: tetratricopeptide repeat protein [Bacteroidetes bacterium]|jgi:PAS domain S-box-containing protein|nr:tetratricopeptide repeat protein [Bacteroidota bacterium]MBT6685027.1 tetratricopeptide repeat protein [Bacteroidota bacterium]MBT7143105.1 tetratricopeptide repeat protein [Bacteroidota bacterium]MBT7491482.1 tetratricopeptide repeat protein [Bacteroidota bacterium]